MEKDQKIQNIRHSLSHLLASAVLSLYPDTKMTIGPAIENGFYYDFDFTTPISDKDLPKIEKKTKEILKKWDKFEKIDVSEKEAKEKFKDNPYKLELIEDLIKDGQKITFYKSGDFVDLCGGGHAESAKDIKPDSFKLNKTAGAYWRGSEKNKMLTRIYGLAFETKKELDEYIQMQEEAKKRDHRKLGKELDLFHMDDMVGLGLPLWHPKGALLWRVIEEFWYKEHLKNGYDLVRSPHIGNRTLWETSGHWGFYNKSMYPPLEVGQTLEERQQNKKTEVSEEYLLKPMNCPFHIEIYKNNPKSYRNLPLRWAECGTVYRFEKRGELSGLTRVRGFTQDDAHIICRKDQVEEELKRVIDFILFIYKSFGFDIEKVKVYLSLRDPKNKDKYAGGDAGWEFTETMLRKVAIDKKLNFKEELGEAAFYGPKLDFKIEDALGREWQCSTLQFDFNLTERFDLTFVNAKGEPERPYMLHRALFGSFERFIGLLIEHYAGAFPVWLSPVQIVVLPISEKHLEYAKNIFEKLKENELRAELDDSNETLGKKIRNSKLQKNPYMIIVGDNEVENKSVTLESRDGTGMKDIKLEEAIEKLKKEITEKK
ncbi:MAG: threonyl-tRNA synthetase [Parcubacteria group bacterium Athens0714_16]|nr:MAG: threonyl-tRNA synthetase [Parcubacteria group bacterium Athens0714_16]